MNAPVNFARNPLGATVEERRALAAAYTGAFARKSKPPLLFDEREAVRVAAAFAEEIKTESADREIEPLPPLLELERASALGLTSLFVPRSHGGPEASYWKHLEFAEGADRVRLPRRAVDVRLRPIATRGGRRRDRRCRRCATRLTTPHCKRRRCSRSRRRAPPPTRPR